MTVRYLSWPTEFNNNSHHNNKVIIDFEMTFYKLNIFENINILMKRDCRYNAKLL